MIDLRLTFTDQEISEYFERAGYATGTGTMGKWRSVSHGEDRWVEFDALVVYMPDGSYVDAREFFQGFVNWQLKNILLADHTSVDKYVEFISRPCLKKLI